MEDRIKQVSEQYRQAAKKIESWMGDQRLSPDYLRFRMNLATAYADALDFLAKSLPCPASAAGEIRPEEVNFEPDTARTLLAAIMEKRGENSPPGSNVARIIERTEKDKNLLPRILRLSVFEPEGKETAGIAAELGLEVVELVSLGRMLAAPFVIAAVACRPPVDPASNDAVFCPACGSPPLLARLRVEDGKRRLVCSLCFNDWPFPRLMCPGCEKTSSDGLTVISMAESEARWIEVCEQCKQYLKTIDERKLSPGEFQAFVEETITLPLDLLAEREGYRRCAACSEK